MKKLEKEEVEIQKLKWQSKNDLKWEKLQWIRRTPQDDATAGNNVCHQGLGFWRVWSCRIYPKDHTLKTPTVTATEMSMALEEGPCFDLGRVSFLTAPPSIPSLLVALTYCKYFWEKWHLYGTQHTWHLGYDLWLSYTALAALLVQQGSSGSEQKRFFLEKLSRTW